MDTESQTIIISAYILSKIPAAEFWKWLTDQRVFRSESGMPMKTIVTFEIDIKIHSYNGNKSRQLFHTIPNVAEACILGIDFIINNSIRRQRIAPHFIYKRSKPILCHMKKKKRKAWKTRHLRSKREKESDQYRRCKQPVQSKLIEGLI